MKGRTLEYVVKVLKGEEWRGYYPESYETIGFLIAHRIAGLFYSRKPSWVRFPPKMEKILSREYENQARRVRFMRRYLRELSSALEESGTEHIFLKGSVLSNAMGRGGRPAFYGPGERSSNDIDILVRSENLTEVSEILKRLGYVQGRYDPESRRIQGYQFFPWGDAVGIYRIARGTAVRAEEI